MIEVGPSVLSIGGEIYPRGECAACCGGGRVLGGRQRAGQGFVGICIRCSGTGLECTADYVERARSEIKVANPHFWETL